ncbi:hypothetical protein INT45_003055 [Circinella minor]|uniref:Histone chaperone RTT106/FACT complex subunit SPT16-like middle domain-containing protein n=1 Tax=Circinella minor TaxID=1195481 RepID=A0A8H7VJT5_9FUNG|nr:hypothetical protein INT45_003055 [Circinella minor]
MTSWLNNIDDINLRESIQQLISIYPDSLSVVQNLINYYNDKLTSTLQQQQENGREHNKKRKLDSPTTPLNEKEKEEKTIIINDISFQLPARKKLNMIFTSTRRLYLVNTKTEEMDFTFDLNALEHVCCVPSPVPTKGHTFTLFFKQQPMDPIVFTIQQKGDIQIIQQQQQPPLILTHEKEKQMIQIVSEQTHHEIQLPSKSIYLSTVLSTTTGKRPDEDRFYANVYLKNKEACLYFLPKGILFGFKKPVYYFPLTILSSTYYSGITQHTFNLTLVLKKNQLPLGSLLNVSKDEQENGSTLEFSMIEQSEFGGIDQYIKKMNINDKSMSEENMAPEIKAKKQQKEEEDGNTRTTLHNNNNNNEEDDDDEENDDDFEPSDDDDEPLEYDTDAGSSQQESSDDNNEEDEEEDEDMMDEDIRIETNKKRPLVDGIDEIDDSKDEGEQDITKTDNEEEEEIELNEEEEEEEEDEDEEEEELQEDNAESESLGSSSEDDIDEDMRDAKSRNIIPEDAKDELEDSD